MRTLIELGVVGALFKGVIKINEQEIVSTRAAHFGNSNWWSFQFERLPG